LEERVHKLEQELAESYKNKSENQELIYTLSEKAKSLKTELKTCRRDLEQAKSDYETTSAFLTKTSEEMGDLKCEN
jgi:chromosome segregation ATPase